MKSYLALACSIMLAEPEDGFGDGGFRVGLVGTVGHAPDYVSRFEECVRLGAPLASVDAYRNGRPARFWRSSNARLRKSHHCPHHRFRRCGPRPRAAASPGGRGRRG